jgi:D-proline reductase (dithiol) PrdB
MDIMRLKNRALAKAAAKYPFLAKRLIDSYEPVESIDVPWSPVRKLLKESKIAIVTTAGIHHRYQKPFDMTDPEGDPTFRGINIWQPEDLMITHDYYDHSDADMDMNIVFPQERLKEFELEGIVGRVSDTHYSFMGHIDGRHIDTLVNIQAPEVAKRLKADNVDIVLLTPG